MRGWTRLVLRLRWVVVLAWLAVVVAGGYASTRLPDLLSNTFSVPGTDSERARTTLERRFGDRSDGEFLVVFETRSARPALGPLRDSVQRAARAVPTGKAGPLQTAPDGSVAYATILTRLDLAEAKSRTPEVRRALRAPPGVRAYVTGQPAIQHDLDPILSGDLRRGESIAIPIAFAVLVAVFGVSLVTTLPFLFAAASILGTLGLVYLIAQHLEMATYVTNLVELIGLGIAIDYSLLVVYRFREELGRQPSTDEAVVRTMETAGRAVVFSGTTVAIGLALLLALPVPFIRSIGIGGFLIPVVSLASALTLQPALLSFYGVRGTRRLPVVDFLRTRLHVPLPHIVEKDPESGFWAGLARTIMRRPYVFLTAGTAVLVAAAIPVFWLQLTPGSAQGIPQSPPAVRGLNVLRDAVGPGTLSPTQIVIDTRSRGAARDAETDAALARLVRGLERDPEVLEARSGTGPRFVDPTGRYRVVIVVGRHEYGEEPAQAFARRLRDRIIPTAGFPGSYDVYAGGGAPQGIDFLDQSYRYFPWLVLGVLVLTYVVLLRAFRSLLLPLKAVLLNLLSVAAAYGILVLVFRFGVGNDVVGLYQYPQVEGWIPIFLFAMLFGLSMDYEVFLVSRMRESWDERHDNARAVEVGLERTGRIVTAAAVIMVAAFAGFIAGSVVGLQEFGVGLAAAILIDATIVRVILVPSLMAVLGRWNWWLPRRAAKIAHVEPSPLPPPRAVYHR